MFIVLHTAFKFKGLVALSFWCMMIVVISGFIGRYFNETIPPILSGLTGSLSEAGELLQSMEKSLHQGEGKGRQVFDNLRRNKNRLQRKAALWKIIQNLLDYWHFFHKPFSLIMYLILAVHVAVAWRFGHQWKF
jgi:hypothetical protein